MNKVSVCFSVQKVGRALVVAEGVCLRKQRWRAPLRHLVPPVNASSFSMAYYLMRWLLSPCTAPVRRKFFLPCNSACLPFNLVFYLKLVLQKARSLRPNKIPVLG